MKLPSSNQITVLVLLVCLICFYLFIFRPFNTAIHNMATGPDAERASKLCNYVLSRVSIGGHSLSNTNQPPVEVQPSRNSARLDFFGVTNSDFQEKICAAAKEWQSTNTDLMKVHIRFLEPEKPRGEYGQHIETLLREEFIVLTNAQSGIIFNQATTKN
jgi:hypothetical protein